MMIYDKERKMYLTRVNDNAPLFDWQYRIKDGLLELHPNYKDEDYKLESHIKTGGSYIIPIKNICRKEIN